MELHDDEHHGATDGQYIVIAVVLALITAAEVTMRLETPVVYFHPPAGSGPLTADVRVRFQGGWLTEYFPFARAEVPGVREGGFRSGRITPEVTGSLHRSKFRCPRR